MKVSNLNHNGRHTVIPNEKRSNPVISKVITYQLNKKELEYYRSLPVEKTEKPLPWSESKRRDPQLPKLTKEIYLDLRREGLKDAEIITQFKLHQSSFYALKRGWGFTKGSPEYQKLKEVIS